MTIHFLDRRNEQTATAIEKFKNSFEKFAIESLQVKLLSQNIIDFATDSNVILHDAAKDKPAVYVHHGFPKEKAFSRNFQWGEEIRFSSNGPVPAHS